MSAQEMADLVMEAPRGRWFFFAGAIKDDFYDLLPAFEVLGLKVPEKLPEGHRFFVGCGTKEANKFEALEIDMSEAWNSGVNEVLLSQNRWSVKRKEQGEKRTMTETGFCQNCNRKGLTSE